MFYLVQFFKFVFLHRLSGFLFLALSAILIVTSLSSRPLKKSLQDRFQVEKPLPYFHALVSGEHDMDFIRYKLLGMSHVERVEVKSSEDLQGQAKELLINLGLAELHREDVYQGLKISLSPSAQSKGHFYDYIKKYMTHLLGDLSVSFSSLETPDLSVLKTKQTSINFLRRWAYGLALLFLGVLWIFSFWKISSGLRKYAYIIEEYQRRSHVSFKMILSGLSVVVVLSNLIFLTEIKVDLLPAFVALALMCIVAALFCLQEGWE